MQIGIDSFVAAIICHGDAPMTVRAMKPGAVKFFTKQFDDHVLPSSLLYARSGAYILSRQRSTPSRLPTPPPAWERFGKGPN